MCIRWFCSRFILLMVVGFFLPLGVEATEKTDWDYPLGPIGGRCYLQLGENSVRVSEVTANAPGATAGLLVNDYIFGAFGEPFDQAVDDTWNFYTGPIKGLGNAIEKAQRSDGVLPLQVLRSEVGIVTVQVHLAANGGLGAAYPLGSTPFEEAYDEACQAIHESIASEGWRGVTGSGYPLRWAGLALISHPNWNETTGDTPYRLSINTVRDSCLSALANAQYAPVENFLLDGTANPNFVNQFAGHENWVLNTSLIFLAEYLQKTKDSQYYDEFQVAAEKLSNRVQWWSDRTGRRPPGGGAHAGVHSDYSNCGFNICTSHSFAALAMASRVTDAEGELVIDLSVTPRDGRHFGYAEGEEKPANALPELPASWDLDSDPSITQKMAWQWQQLKESSHPEFGAIHYWHGIVGPTYARDASARNAGATFAYHTSLGGQAIPAAEQSALDLMTDFSVRFNREHQYAHTHTVSAVTFNHLAIAYWTQHQRRFFFENWRFYWHLAWSPDRPPEYFTTLFENDNDSNYLLGEIFTALPYGVARGGLALVPGWDTEELILDFHNTPHEWEVPEFRTLVTASGSLEMDLTLTNGLGAEITPDSVVWSVTSANAPHFSASHPNSLTSTLQFSQDGRYTVELTVTAGSRSLTEHLQIHVHTRSSPAGYQLGSAFYQAYGDSGNGETIVSISGTGSWEKFVHQLDIPPLSEKTATKVSGAIVPLESGAHRFYIASRNDAHLSIDSNGDGELEQIASSTEEPDDYDWTANANQQSAVFNLVAGQAYPFEVIHKTDRYQPGPLAVGWITPSNPAIEVIDSSVLAVPSVDSETPAITREPIDYERGVGSYVGLFVTVSGSQTNLYQWYRNGEAMGPASLNSSFALWPTGAGSAGEYHCVITAGDHVLTSRTATVNITGVDELVSGSLWMDMFTETDGSLVADLCDDIGFPWLIDGYSSLNSFAYSTEVSTSNQLGHRATGWLLPTDSGNYRFYVCGDDRVQLFLSPTEYAAHRTLVAENSGSTDEMTWSAGQTGVSDYIPLVGGQRYYVELLHKEQLRDSHFSVAWQKEGDPAPVNGSGEIAGEFLQHQHGGYFQDVGSVPPYYVDELYIAGFLDTATYDDAVKGGRFGDASGNGLANVFYYLFDLGDPEQPAVPNLPSEGPLAPGLPVVTSGDDGSYIYSYVFPRGDLPFDAYPAVSADMVNWLPVDDPESVQPSSITSEILDDDYEVRHLHFQPSSGKLFFRMEVISAP